MKWRFFFSGKFFRKPFQTFQNWHQKLSQFCTFCDFGRTFPPVFFEFKKNIKETQKSIKVKNFEIFFRTFWLKKLSQFFDFVDFRQKNGVFSLPQNGRFLKIWKLFLQQIQHFLKKRGFSIFRSNFCAFWVFIKQNKCKKWKKK